jgi:hypothetical protein
LAVWRAYELISTSWRSTGLSNWYRFDADYHLAKLMDAEGPFKYCSPQRGHADRRKPLPLAKPPSALFAVLDRLPDVPEAEEVEVDLDPFRDV